MSSVLKELHQLNLVIRELQQENRMLKEQVNDLRQRLDSTYAFIHNTGNSEYVKQDWDGVMGTRSVTTGNSERLDHLTKKFGIDEYPLE